MSIEGGCLCGAVRYSLTAEPIAGRVCWCRLCQKLGAGGPTVNAMFPADALTVTGETADFPAVADSGSHMHRRFCPKCGTHLFSAAEERPHIVVVRAGSLDDPEAMKPEMTIWTEAAPGWACFDPSIPAVPQQAPPPK